MTKDYFLIGFQQLSTAVPNSFNQPNSLIDFHANGVHMLRPGHGPMDNDSKYLNDSEISITNYNY